MEKQIAPHCDHQLPQVSQDHAINGGFFYKTVERLPHQQSPHFCCRLGLKVYRCQPFQVDHLVYMAQLINHHLSWCQLTFLPNRYLFLEVTISFQEGQQDEFPYISRERQMFSQLRAHSVLIQKLIEEQLNRHNFLAKDSDQQSFRQKIDILLKQIDGDLKGRKRC